MSATSRLGMNDWTKSLITLTASLLLAAAFAPSARAQEFALDPSHSRIGFAISHMGLSTVKGQFTNYTAKLLLPKAGTNTLAAEAVIQVASINTDWAARDAHLLKADFFDAAAFPEIRFKAEGLKKAADGNDWILKGAFVMHGVSKEVALPCTVVGPITDPWGKQRLGFSARMVVNRHDYGVGADKVTDKAIGSDVAIEIDAEAVATGK